ncbi:MAG: MFS transporter [Hyphomonadaceae bacterium]
MTIAPAPDSAASLLRERNYMLFWFSRALGSLGTQLQSVAMGWELYALARHENDVHEAALMLGLLGAAGFLPMFLLALPAGEIADRRDRRAVMLICLAAEAALVSILALATFHGAASVELLIGVAVAFGASRAFFNPANTALGPTLVPRALLPRSVAWNSLAGQSAAVGGPALAGVLVAISPTAAYATALVLYGLGAVCVLLLRAPKRDVTPTGSRWALMREGLSYVWGNKIVFGAISLDLVAVLLGGATALLPVFARDVLHVGPEGFGILRAAPAVGATLVGVTLAVRPVRYKAGVVMLSGVALFGAATVVFGLSTSLWLSCAALAVVGGADMLSVFVRQTLVQVVTPDHMRGRVSAVSSLFIGASNELGELESGVVARFIGPVSSAIVGGFGAIGVTLLWAKLFPALRKFDRLV